MNIERKSDDPNKGSDKSIEVKQALEKITDQVKEQGEKALAEAKKGIEMASGQKERVDELLTKQAEIQQEMKELQQKIARPDFGGGRESKSLGEQFVGKEGFEEYKALPGNKGKFVMSTKAVTTVTTDGAGPTGTVAAGQSQRVQNPMMMPAQRQFFLRDLIASGRTGLSAIEFVRITGFQNGAQVQANQGDLKGKSDLTSELVTETVKTVAHTLDVSLQALDDSDMLASIIDSLMIIGLKQKEEEQLLMGSGVGGDFDGIYTQATDYAQPAGVLAAEATPTALDVLRLAVLQSQLAELPNDGFVLNPLQWTSIELMKDDMGRYIIGNPQGSLAPTLWGRPVVATNAMTSGKFLTGAFGLGAQVFDRQQASISVSTENKDNFERNLATVRAEERLAAAVYRPEAFIKGDLPVTVA